MAKIELTNEQFRELSSLFDGEDESVRADYSGRAMWGNDCVGYVGKDVGRFIFEVANLLYRKAEGDFDYADGDNPHPEDVLDGIRDQIDRLGNPRSDSMGYDIIYYWPNLTAPSVEFDE